MAKDDGIAMISAGEGRSWFWGGKTEVSLKKDFSLSASVKTEVSIGIKTDLSLAVASSISLSSKIEAVRGLKLSYGKTDSFETKEKGSFKVMDAYNGSVGHNAVALARVKTLRTALGIILGVQAAATLAVAGTAIAQKVKYPEDDVFNFPKSGVNMNAVINLIAGIGTLGSALALFFYKLIATEQQTVPACSFSMHKTGVCFLGTNTGSTASGITIDSSKVLLTGPRGSADYDQPILGDTILGFTVVDHPGARANELEVTAAGTAIKGNSFVAEVDTNAKVMAEKSVLLQVGDDPAPKAAIECATSGILMHSGPTPGQSPCLAMNSDSISGTVGGPAGSSLHMTAKEASLGAAGNNLTLNTSGATFTFGGTTVKLDATGFSIGSNLMVLNPGPPALTFAGLQSAMRSGMALSTEFRRVQQQFLLMRQKQRALERANKVRNRALVTVENQVKAATQTSETATTAK